MKIAILDDYQDAVRQLACYNLLEGHTVKVFTNSARGLGQLSVRLAPFDAVVLIGERTYLSRQLLDKLPNLRWLAQTGVVQPQVDLGAAAERGMTVAAGLNDPISTAELTWALLMNGSRKIRQYADCLRAGVWQASSLNPQHNTLGAELHGKTFGIWGFGRVGQRVACGIGVGVCALIYGQASTSIRCLPA
jgi:D-3-phosphoglycerate dehydrogenase